MIRRRLLCYLLFVICYLSAAVSALAQQRPLQTEDPETIGAGRILIEAGLDYKRDVYLPVSGLRGNLFAVPALGVSLGVSSIAEIQMQIGGYQQMAITDRAMTAPFANLLLLDGNTTDDLEDMHIGAKVRLVSEGARRPSIASRFSTRLPNAGNESGLGKDMQDFETSILFAKTVQSVRVVGNVGLLMLGNPTRPAAQDDLLFYNLSVARAISPAAEIVGEFVGRANFAKTTTLGAEDRGLLRFGARYTHAGVRLDGGILLGLTPRDPEIGLTAGFTWVFNAVTIP
ncbi:MAG TPA: hypothetical protein VJ691_15410 [Vicinamibacterales bacterium]|nr:hypothetical protein [Vicinamibacterales bacterium]